MFTKQKQKLSRYNEILPFEENKLLYTYNTEAKNAQKQKNRNFCFSKLIFLSRLNKILSCYNKMLSQYNNIV